MIVRLRTDEIAYLEKKLEHALKLNNGILEYWLKNDSKCFNNILLPLKTEMMKTTQEQIDTIENILVALADAVMEI